jgi:bifunctional DNA-binding transcriptional regulator/antitoxin component of YhaV-PrlF toxin-antitoxin module
MVTLPVEVAAALKLKDNERVKVLFDRDKKRVIYQF